jgi:membrane associated rhomboid family serine protease
LKRIITTSPSTLLLLSIAVMLQCLCSIDPTLVDKLAYDPAAHISIFQIITHILAHASWEHLMGNFLFGLPFMVYLENKLGSKRFLEFYMLCGLGGLLLHMIVVGGGCIGSSSAIFGATAGACMVYGNTALDHCLGMLFIAIRLIQQILMAPLALLMGIAVFGHIGGILTGLMLVKRLYRTEIPTTKPPAKPSNT